MGNRRAAGQARSAGGGSEESGRVRRGAAAVEGGRGAAEWALEDGAAEVAWEDGGRAAGRREKRCQPREPRQRG